MTGRQLSKAHRGLGALLLVAPGVVLEPLARREASPAELRVARVLGLRHLLQAAVVARRPSRAVLLAGAAIDLTHSLSMVLLASMNPGHRRLATASALTAAATAAVGVAAARAAARPASTAATSFTGRS